MMATRHTREERDRLIEGVLQRMRDRLERELRDDMLQKATLDQIEEIASRVGRDLSKQVQERLVEERTREARENQADCRCGGRARYKGKPARTLVTAHGLLSYQRPSYHCPACQKS